VDILYLLIPMSAVLVLMIIGVFGWALHKGQFEDLDHEGVRILQHDEPLAAPLDVDQGPPVGATKESPHPIRTKS
jgi:cbb3-type cytochrome oxidase maturation protein